MKTSKQFQKLIRANKEKLALAGIKIHTIRSWAYGYRMPDLKNAVKISQILEIPLDNLVYRHVYIHIPSNG